MAHYYKGSVKDALDENWEQVQGTVAWAVKSALVQRGRFADLQAAGEETRKELEDEARRHVERDAAEIAADHGGEVVDYGNGEWVVQSAGGEEIARWVLG